LWGLVITLGYSRRMMAEAAADQRLGTLRRMNVADYRIRGGVMPGCAGEFPASGDSRRPHEIEKRI
jgi:hypothetical protein